jgi:hypothetical protein
MELIEKKGVKVFYVGTQGSFDQYGTPFIRKVWRRFPDDMQFHGGIDGWLNEPTSFSVVLNEKRAVHGRRCDML